MIEHLDLYHRSMLDIDTLRTVQAVLAMCVFALVFFGTYRATRAPYAFWWAGVLVVSSASSAMYLLNTTPAQPVTDAIGQGLGPVAGACAWAASRSLRSKPTAWWQLYPAGVAVFAFALMDRRDDGTLPGTPALLTAMVVMFTLTARELWKYSQNPHVSRDREIVPGARVGVVVMALASALIAVFYAVRLGVFAVLGPTSHFYLTWTGPVTTTLFILILLVVVTHTVGALSQLESSHEWRRRATYDDLTGLLGRNAFMERASALLAQRHAEGVSPTLVIADFDRFKEINDERGHAAGDRALEAFGDACHRLLTREDLACRLGGDEFALVLAGADVEEAEALTSTLSTLFVALMGTDVPCPTVSFGIAPAERSASLSESLRYADDALYQAKRAGGNRSVIFARVTR